MALFNRMDLAVTEQMPQALAATMSAAAFQPSLRKMTFMNPLITAYGALLLGIVSEIVGSSLLPKTQQFTKFGPTAAVIASFVVALFFLSHALRVIPLGVTYAIWCGLGIVLTTIVSIVVYRSPLDLPAAFGIFLIICGVVVMNIFSKSISN